MVSEWQPIKYDDDENGSILLPAGAPFDGTPVLVQAPGGVVEAWWDVGGWTDDTPVSPREYEGWCWVCYDDKFHLELDDVSHWMPLPTPPSIKEG